MLSPWLVNERSPLFGEECALCKQPFVAGDRVVICPEDASRHHIQCWRANRNRCTAYGCQGRGEVANAPRLATRPSPGGDRGGVVIDQPRAAGRSKVRVMPSGGIGCAQTCLIIAIALAIILFALGCFGLWLIADYIMIDVLNWPYRPEQPAVIAGTTLAALVAVQSSLATR